MIVRLGWFSFARCIHHQRGRGPPLASTIETWWSPTLRFLQTGLTNARTEGINRAGAKPPYVDEGGVRIYFVVVVRALPLPTASRRGTAKQISFSRTRTH